MFDTISESACIHVQRRSSNVPIHYSKALKRQVQYHRPVLRILQNRNSKKKKKNQIFFLPVAMHNNEKMISGKGGGYRPWSHGGCDHVQSRTPCLGSPYDAVFPMRVSLIWGLDHGCRPGCLPHQKTFSMIWKGLWLDRSVCRRCRGQFKGTERSENRVVWFYE